jgi:hypothetical protein
MKSRKLKEIMNGLNYIYSIRTRDAKRLLCVGSAMCTDLITVDMDTLKVKYALDTFHEGRKAIKNDKIEFIWDKLHELIETGEIHDIANGKDILDNPIPVYTVKDGELIECFTDDFDSENSPGVTDDGEIMYINTFFLSKKEAIERGMREEEAGIKYCKSRLEELDQEIIRYRKELEISEKYLENLETLYWKII